MAPLPPVLLIELLAAPLPPVPLVELPAAPLPLAEPPVQLPEVPAAVADVPVAPPAALPHTARRYVPRRAVCGRAARGAIGTSATAAGTSGS